MADGTHPEVLTGNEEKGLLLKAYLMDLEAVQERHNFNLDASDKVQLEVLVETTRRRVQSLLAYRG